MNSFIRPRSVVFSFARQLCLPIYRPFPSTVSTFPLRDRPPRPIIQRLTIFRRFDSFRDVVPVLFIFCRDRFGGWGGGRTHMEFGCSRLEYIREGVYSTCRVILKNVKIIPTFLDLCVTRKRRKKICSLLYALGARAFSTSMILYTQSQ